MEPRVEDLGLGHWGGGREGGGRGEREREIERGEEGKEGEEGRDYMFIIFFRRPCWSRG